MVSEGTLILKLECSAGSGILDAATELIRIATTLRVICEADFNGVKLLARAGDDPARLVADWEVAMARGYTFAVHRHD